MNTVNSVIADLQQKITDYDDDTVRIRRHATTQADDVDAAISSTIADVLRAVVDRLRPAAPDPALYIAADAGGDLVLWRDTGSDEPVALAYRFENPDLWDAVIDGRFPVREEVTS